jgi:WD40 repeat protein
VPIAAIVVGGIIFLSVLTGPSGLEPEDETPTTQPITAQTTTTVQVPGSSRDVWRPPSGTWVGGFSFSSSRPETLYGPSLTPGLLNIGPDTVIVDALPDGRLVGVDQAGQRVVLIGSGPGAEETALLLWPGSESMPPLLSPDGTRLAMIDATGVPFVWTIGTPADLEVSTSEQLISPRDSAATAVEAIASLTWAPDSSLLALNAFQGGYYLWDLATNSVSRTSTPGRAIAVSNTRVAAWGSTGLELRDLTGRVLRRWDDLLDPFANDLSPSGSTLQLEGVFDPLQRYLAVRGQVGPDGNDGLTVLSMIGTTRQLLTTEPAQGFTWSGDGSGLYWMDSSGLQVWSGDPERASATMLGGSGEVLNRLRVYDPATSPILHAALHPSSLFEQDEGTMYLRTAEGRELIYGFEQVMATIAPAGVDGFLIAVLAGTDEQPVILANPNRPGTEVIIGALTAQQFPPGARIARALAVSPGDGPEWTFSELGATRWYLEIDDGSILFGPDAGLFTTVAEGSSLNELAGIPFHVTADGSAMQTLPVGTGINNVLTAAKMGVERILAVGVVRRTLFVLAADNGGTAQIWQVPGDSPLLTPPFFPEAPAITSDTWSVYTSTQPVTGGRILADPDTGPMGELLAARLDGPAGPITVLLAAPLALESVCGARAGGACVVTETSGSPLGFSPDGNWLLIDGDAGYVALSTVGRGRVSVSDTSPDDVAWIPGSP